MRLSKRLDRLPPYLFLEISRKIAEKRARGEDVVTFGIGDPDIPTPKHILDKIAGETYNPPNHRYPETDGLPALRKAIADWYGQRFGQELDPNKEVVPLIGAKEGIGHVAFCFVDPGDVALIPDPAYPVYNAGTLFAGGEPYFTPLKEENGWLPDLDAIPADVAQRATCLWVNYPNNPTGAVAEADFYERCIAFARRNEVAILSDAAYSEMAFDGYKPMSFLEMPGAREVGVEFHSLSKCYNMTGWRVGMAVGNAAMVDALTRLKSNLDSGIPQSIQYGAIEALTGPQDIIADNVAVYRRRRDQVLAALDDMGLAYTYPKAGLYIWASVPSGYASAEFATLLLDEASVVVTPGTGYGQAGEGYFRISLTTPDERVEEGLNRLRNLKIPPKDG